MKCRSESSRRRSRPCSSGIESASGTRGVPGSSEASDGQEVVRLLPSLHPDVAVLDISMPLLNGVDAARELQKASPKTKIILLTRHDEDQYVTESLRAGVKGYVLKSQAATDLVHAIQQVSRGAIYLSPSISRAVVEAYFQDRASRGPAHVAGNAKCFNLSAKGNQPRTLPHF